MPGASLDNVGGHRAKYEHLKKHVPADQVGVMFVGESDPLWTGYNELELIRKFKPLGPDTSIIDIGCGIGRLTQHVLHENIGSYIGTEIIPEIMAEAQRIAAGDMRFRFELVDSCSIPALDSSTDVVVAYSVITHLLDEEVYEYFKEARRVLRPGGAGLFSFMDLVVHKSHFLAHAAVHRQGHGDLQAFTTKETLAILGAEAGFEQIDFFDGFDGLPTSGIPSPLVPEPPSTFSLGQSLCVLR